jgi:hypothetical protein
MEGLGRHGVGANLPEAGDVLPGTAAEAGTDEACLRAILAAVAAMAVQSRRRQAELDAALWRARITIDRVVRQAVVAQLSARGFVEGVVGLRDGGVLLSLTSRGLAYLDGDSDP